MNRNGQPLPQARTKDLVTRELPDEMLIYDLKAHQAHCLNRTAATVWKYCDGQTSVSEMTARLKEDFNPAIDEAAVWQALERLSKAHLLEARVAPPAGLPRLGRREAMRRLGLGSAIAVPLVMSIVAPTALAGCTFENVADGGQCCINSQCINNCCATGTCSATGQANGTACTASCQCLTNCCNIATNQCSPIPGNTCIPG